MMSTFITKCRLLKLLSVCPVNKDRIKKLYGTRHIYSIMQTDYAI